MRKQKASKSKFSPAISRRAFIGGSAAAAAMTIVPVSVLGGPGRTAPSDKLNIAGIGVGGQGRWDIDNVSSQNIVALCDVDWDRAADTFKSYPKARKYRDFRVMLEKEKGIDAVVVATPDHNHAVASMTAIKMGKHVYCEKPLTRTVREARAVAEAAAEAGVATQMGNQGMAFEGNRLINEWIWDGAIGPVREVHAWSDRPTHNGELFWAQGVDRPKDTPAVPSTLDWDLWLGPAPERPYHQAYHPGVWRCWWDFGCGMMGDRGAHTLDPVFWALKLGHPTSVEAASLELNPDTHPIASIVTYRFPARGDLPPVKLTWYDGLRAPRPMELEDGRQLGNVEGGALFKGNKGKLMAGVYGEGARLIPESRMKEYEPPSKTIPRVPDSHEQDWVRACKEGRPAGADFEYSGLLTEVCLLGNVARRVDARIEWDPVNMKVTNMPEANKYVRTQYREGWSL